MARPAGGTKLLESACRASTGTASHESSAAACRARAGKVGLSAPGGGVDAADDSDHTEWHQSGSASGSTADQPAVRT